MQLISLSLRTLHYIPPLDYGTFMMKPIRTILVAIFLSISISHAQTTADSTAIKATALNYIEGWYEGNSERMEHALHPELAKRIVTTDAQSGKSRFGQMSALTLINNVKAGGGKN